VYSRFTCKQIKNVYYNIKFYIPDNTEFHLGTSNSLEGCQNTAYNYSYENNFKYSDYTRVFDTIQNRNWQYVCCLKTKNPCFVEKNR